MLACSFISFPCSILKLDNSSNFNFVIEALILAFTEYIKIGLKRGVIGIPIGVLINIVLILFSGITIITREFLMLQTIISMVLGFVSCSLTVIFEVDEWSITGQTLIHFILFVMIFIPSAIIGKWIPSNIIGIAIFTFIALFVYIATWLSMKYYWRERIEEINEKLDRDN